MFAVGLSGKVVDEVPNVDVAAVGLDIAEAEAIVEAVADDENARDELDVIPSSYSHISTSPFGSITGLLCKLTFTLEYFSSSILSIVAN